MPAQSLPPRKRGAGIQSGVVIVREILDSRFRWNLETGHLSGSAAARRPLILRAL